MHVPTNVRADLPTMALLPCGRHAARTAVVRRTQRTRMLTAMVQAVAEKAV
jgi:hypothetical protein